jgi:hypothetical protein
MWTLDGLPRVRSGEISLPSEQRRWYVRWPKLRAKVQKCRVKWLYRKASSG